MTLAQLIEREPGLIDAYRNNWAATVTALGETYSWGEIAAAFATVRALETRVAVLGGVRPAARCLFQNKNTVNRAVNKANHERHKLGCREYEVTREHGELLANATVEQNKILLQILEALSRIATALEENQ